MTDKERIIIFGRGNLFLRKKDRILNDYDVLCFLDNSVSDKMLDNETGVSIINPKYVSEYINEKIVIMSNAVGEMFCQLIELGVDKDRIIFGQELEPFNSLEKMLFSDGDGEIVYQDNDLYFRNDKHKIFIKLDRSDFNNVKNDIKESRLYKKSDKMLGEMPLEPLDDTYGVFRGSPIDRYYIERFLEKNRDYIKGDIVEIGDRRYTDLFGEDISSSTVIHVEYGDDKRGIIKGNLETGEGIPDSMADCLICTQTLQFIYNSEAAAKTIIRLLKPGGYALVTVSGISQIIRYEKIKYGHFWNFTDMSLKRLFEDIGGCESALSTVYGNVKSATSFLYGISREELSEEELEYCDENYQVIIGAVVKKKI